MATSIVHTPDGSDKIGMKLADTYVIGTDSDFSKFNVVSPQWPVGTRVRSLEGGEFILGVAVGAGEKGQFYFFDKAWSGTRITSANSGSAFGLTLAALYAESVAAGAVAWFQVRGKASCAVKANCAPNVALATSTTAGSLDDSVANGHQYIHGVTVLGDAIASSNHPTASPSYIINDCLLNDPYVGIAVP